MRLKGGAMFSKILFPTDFSEASQLAMNCIPELRQSGLKEVVVLHVNDFRGIDKLQPFVINSRFLEARSKVLKENETAMQTIAKQLEADGIATKLVTRSGCPIEEILKVEDEENVSVVVMGSHNWSHLLRLFTPSVAEAVVHRSKRPVVVVKQPERCN
jgi:nucleotide-binding universal stress UspA family protein